MSGGGAGEIRQSTVTRAKVRPSGGRQAAWGKTAEGVDALRAEAAKAVAAKVEAETAATDLRQRLEVAETALQALTAEVRPWL